MPKKTTLQDVEDLVNSVDNLEKELSERNKKATGEYLKSGAVPETVRNDIETLKKQLRDLETVLSHTGALPKKLATKPWDSRHRPFHRDIFKVEKERPGFEITFISEKDVDDYLARGYNIAEGSNYGEKQGPIKRRRMIGVERPVEDAEKDRAALREFNEAQRTSALQKTEAMSARIQRMSGRKTQLKYDISP